MQKFLIAILLLAGLAQPGSGLQCWECSEALENGEACKDPFMNRVSRVTCLPGQVCVKQVTPKIIIGDIEVAPVVTRACSDIAVCESSIKKVSEHCSVCNITLCNSSGIAVPSLITVGALLIATKCLYDR